MRRFTDRLAWIASARVKENTVTASSRVSASLVVTLSAETSDPFDAAIRVLGDAQRYGFGLEKLEISTAGDGAMALRLDLRVPPDSDIGNLRDRFSRHDILTAVDLGAS
jgi:hypothetical protein